MRIRALVLACGMALLLLPMAPDSTVRADDGCFSTHTSGSGVTFMKVCISEHGNVVGFESPASEEHIRIGNFGEGYVLCSTSGVHGFDAGYAESGFGPPTITQPKGPNTLPLTIVRDTTDGDFRLTQKFSIDTEEKEVAITMDLRNISGALRQFVQLDRYFDGDIGASNGGDVWDKSESSAWGREAATGENPGLMLTGITFGTNHSAFVEDDAAWDPNTTNPTAATCSPDFENTPTGEGSFVGRVGYDLFNMNAGQKKTVKFLYRRF